MNKEWNTLGTLNNNDFEKFEEFLVSLKLNLNVENYINDYFCNMKFLKSDSKLSTFLQSFNNKFKQDEQIFETFQLNPNYPKLNEFITQNYDDLKNNRFKLEYLQTKYKLPFDSVSDIFHYFNLYNCKYSNNNIFYFLRYLYSEYINDDDFFTKNKSSNNDKKIDYKKPESNFKGFLICNSIPICGTGQRFILK